MLHRVIIVRTPLPLGGIEGISNAPCHMGVRKKVFDMWGFLVKVEVISCMWGLTVHTHVFKRFLLILFLESGVQL